MSVAQCNRTRLGFTCAERARPHARHQVIEADRRATWTDYTIGVTVLPLAADSVLPDVGSGPNRDTDRPERRELVDRDGHTVTPADYRDAS